MARRRAQQPGPALSAEYKFINWLSVNSFKYLATFQLWICHYTLQISDFRKKNNQFALQTNH